MGSQLEPYVALLRQGGVVACATETLFGLLADARSERAVARVVAIKHRASAPIALLVPDLAAAEALALLGREARALAERFWPGPLTLVVQARAGLLPQLLRDGTVGLRVPGASPALELVRAFGGPLTATSCNPSGLPAARTSQEARAYFGDELAAIIDGEAPGGLPSTLVEATGSSLRVLRSGAISLEA